MWTCKGRTLVFDGFTKVRGANKADDDILLPAVKVGEVLKLEKLDPSQHFTKPPARFTEASLVKELENILVSKGALVYKTRDGDYDLANSTNNRKRNDFALLRKVE